METEFAERLAMLRQERGLTQQRLADKLGLTAQAISKYEKGISLPEVDTLKSIATVLDCSTDYLLGHELTKESRVDMLARERSTEIDRAMHKEELVLNVGMGPLVDMLMEENKNRYEGIHQLRVRLAGEYGILVPVIRLKDQWGLAKNEYEIRLNDRTVLGKGTLEYPMLFYIGEKAENESQIEGEEPVWHNAGVWRPAEANTAGKKDADAKAAADAGGEPAEDAAEGTQKNVRPLTCMDIIIAHLEKLILENYDKILNRQLVAEMTEKARSWYPASIDGVVPEKVSLARLQRAIAGLIRERIPVNRLDLVVDFLEEHPENNGEELAELMEMLRP